MPQQSTNLSFDPGKPVRTRDGRKARIVCTDRKNDFPIVALVTCVYDQKELCLSYYEAGRVHPSVDSPVDLINVPETVVTFALVSKTGNPSGMTYSNQNMAENVLYEYSKTYSSILRMEIEVGTGRLISCSNVNT